MLMIGHSKRRRIASGCLGLAQLVALAIGQTSPSAGITYQGRLKQIGQPANGSYDIVFGLYDSAGGSGAIGTQQQTNIDVAEGLFTVLLNGNGELGPTAFNGDARWLEISVRPSGSGQQYQTLAPRQQLSAAPYAVYALGAPTGHALDAVDGSPSNAVYVDPSGRVGIGTTAPAENMEILGSAGNVGVSISSPGSTYAAINFRSGSSARWGLGKNPGDHFYIDESGVATRFLIEDGTGNVGIGTSTPSSRLDVAGTVEMDGFKLNTGAAAGRLLVSDANGAGTWQAPPAGSQWQSGAAGSIFYNAGNVGIGTSTPGAKLVVDENTNSNVSLSIDSGLTNSFYSAVNFLDRGTAKWGMGKTPGNQFYIDETGVGRRLTVMPVSGNIGIGTLSPTAKLEVSAPPDMSAFALAGSGYVEMKFAPLGMPNLGTRIWAGGGDPNSFAIRNDRGGNIYLLTEGSGRTVVNVLEIIGGSDLAEPFDASGADEIEPGMVVCIDPDNPGKLRLSREAYDNTVAGIISGAGGVKTGMMLRQEGTIADGKHALALSGRVYCQVDADAGGPVKAGDLLTTSDTPGHAMRASKRERAAGAVIGKAMTSLESGRGLVLVLVNLQ